MSTPASNHGIFGDLSRRMFGEPRHAFRVIRALREAVTATAWLCAGVLIVLATVVAIAWFAAVMPR